MTLSKSWEGELIINSRHIVTSKNLNKVSKRIKRYINRTPCIYSQELSEYFNHPIYLKLENLQVTGGFKIRGNLNKMSILSKEKKLKSGVVTASSGNHGLGLSLSARYYSVNATVVLPNRTPKNKIKKIKKYGAKVVIRGETYNESVIYATKISNENGSLYIPSFDDYDIIVGNATIGLEIYKDVPNISMVICPIGGGGGISGIGLALRNLSQSVNIIGVQAEGASSMFHSLKSGKIVRLEKVETLADGIAVCEPGKKTFDIVKKIVNNIVLVSDEEMQKTVRKLMFSEKIIVELAGAASVAGLYKLDLSSIDGAIVCLISGGNIDEKFLLDIIKSDYRTYNT